MRQRHILRQGAVALLVAALLAGCSSWLPPRGIHVVTAPAPSDVEHYCAWYGDSDGRTLYVGLSPFWSAMRAAGGDPSADLRKAGPSPIGRFDLSRERWLPPLEVGQPGSRSGVWDVYAHDEGQLYFTRYFETSGRVDPRSGRVTRFEAAGHGLNELAPGPQGGVLVSRYGTGTPRTNGELLDLDRSGSILARWSLPSPIGFYVAPKTPAWDPVRRRLLTTTDLFPEFEGTLRHDAYRLSLAQGDGQWRLHETPELQFVVATADGTEYRVEAEANGRLWLRRILPPGSVPQDARVLLDASFHHDFDFAQDLKIAPDGRVVVTRWSGVLHVVDPGGHVATARLPRLAPGGLYYTGVIHGDRLCASYCADVTVVCIDAP